MSPLALQVATTLRRRIIAGELADGKPIPAERDLVQQFEVSRGVVRQALDILHREGLLLREAHCRPVIRNAQGSSTRGTDRTKADHINVWLWPSTSDFVASRVFRGVQDGLRNSPLRIVVGSPRQGVGWDDAVHDEVAFLDQVADDPSCAGVLIWAIGEKEVLPSLQRCLDSRLPVVFLDREPPSGWSGDMVCTDGFGSARDAASHLLRLGHRRAGILTNRDGASSVRERAAGFASAWLEEPGAQLSPTFTYAPEDWEEDPAVYQRIAEAILQDPNKPTAIFAINDTLALGLLGAFDALHVPVPERISVVGCDGLLQWLPGGGNLTSLHQDFHRMGELAVQLLLRRIAEKGDPALPRRHVLLQAPLVVRETTSQPSPDLAASPTGKESSIS